MTNMKFDHLYDRDLVRNRTLILIGALNNNPTNNENFVANVKIVDLCLILYDIKLDARLLLDESFNDLDSFKELIAEWLKEKHTISWMLTSAAVDELIDLNLVERNELKSLVISKKSNL